MYVRLLYVLVALDPALDVDVGHVALGDGRVLLHHHVQHVVQHDAQLVPEGEGEASEKSAPGGNRTRDPRVGNKSDAEHATAIFW